IEGNGRVGECYRLSLLLVSTFTVPAVAGAASPDSRRASDAPPVLQVALAASTDTATPGQSVTFSYAAISLDSSNPLRAVMLDFGDGNNTQFPIASIGPTEGTFSHIYTEAQSYTATLSATADDGTSTATSLSLRVRAPSGSERSSAGQSRTGIVGQAIGFTAD